MLSKLFKKTSNNKPKTNIKKLNAQTLNQVIGGNSGMHIREGGHTVGAGQQFI